MVVLRSDLPGGDEMKPWVLEEKSPERSKYV